MRKLICTLGVLAALILVPGPARGAAMPFSDVTAGAWFASGVEYVYDNGLMNGVSVETFAPDSPFTRAMLVTVLYRMEGGAPGGAADFSDVPDGQWYTDPVGWAAGEGIVNGMGGGSFAPALPVTREQLAALLYRTEGEPESTGSLDGFADGAAVSGWAAGAVAWAADRGLLQGSGGRLDPQGTATRAQVAAVLARYGQTRGFAADWGEKWGLSWSLNYTAGVARLQCSGVTPQFKQGGDGAFSDETPWRDLDLSGIHTLILEEGITWNSQSLGFPAIKTLYLPSTYHPENLGLLALGYDGLENVWVSENNPAYRSQDGVVFSKDGSALIGFPSGRTGSYAIPETVTALGEDAFLWSRLTELTVPETVQTLAPSVFSNSHLEKITLPDTLTELPDGIFAWCGDLKEVRFSPALESVGSHAFFACASLPAIDLPETVRTIGNDAFSWCSSLTELVIPEGVTFIGQDAFHHCDNLQSVSLPSTLTEIERAWSQFSESGRLEKLTVAKTNPRYETEHSLLLEKETGTLLVCAPGKAGSAVLPDRVKTIGVAAFNGCGKLTELVTGPGVETIGVNAFSGCGALERIRLGANARASDEQAENYGELFNPCKSLRAIDVDPANPRLRSVDGVLFDKTGETLLRVPAGRTGTYAVPTGTKTVRRYALAYCDELTEVTVPEGVETLEEWAFYRCGKLAAVRLPASLKTMDGAFGHCRLTDIWFAGTEAQWQRLVDDYWSQKSAVLDPTVHFGQ